MTVETARWSVGPCPDKFEQLLFGARPEIKYRRAPPHLQTPRLLDHQRPRLTETVDEGTACPRVCVCVSPKSLQRSRSGTGCTRGPRGWACAASTLQRLPGDPRCCLVAVGVSDTAGPGDRQQGQRDPHQDSSTIPGHRVAWGPATGSHGDFARF